MISKTTRLLHISNGNPNPSPLLHSYCRSSVASDSIPKFEQLIRTRCQSRGLSAVEALGFFHAMADMRPMPSIWSFNRLIASLSSTIHSPTAVSMYTHLARSRRRDFEPDICTLTIVAKCLPVKSCFSVLPIAFKSGLRPDSRMMTTLLDGLCKSGSMSSAIELYEKMVSQNYSFNEATFGTIINGFCKSGETRRALSVLKKMSEKAGVEPNAVCFNAVIDALCKEKRVEEALGLFRDMIRRGIRPDFVGCTSMIHGFCSLGRLREAVSFFSEMDTARVSLNALTYNIAIGSLCGAGEIDEAVSLFDTMRRRRIEPDLVTFNSIFAALSRSGRFEEANSFVEKMIESGIAFDAITLNTMLDALCKNDRTDEALGHFEAMISSGLKPDVCAYNSLIHGLCKSGQWKQASELLKTMKKNYSEEENSAPTSYDLVSEALSEIPSPTKIAKRACANRRAHVATYSSLLGALCRSGRLRNADTLFNKMAKKSVLPNRRTCNVLLDALCNKGMVENAKRLVESMVQFGEEKPDVVTYAILMKGYCMHCEVEKAREIFRHMILVGIVPDQVSYCTLVVGYLRVGKPNVALKVLKKMVERGMMPDHVSQRLLEQSLCQKG